MNKYGNGLIPIKACFKHWNLYWFAARPEWSSFVIFRLEKLLQNYKKRERRADQAAQIKKTV